jgi:hypothetical protein
MDWIDVSLVTDPFKEDVMRDISWDMVNDHLCGLVIRVPCYRSRGPGFDSRRYYIF